MAGEERGGPPARKGPAPRKAAARKDAAPRQDATPRQDAAPRAEPARRKRPARRGWQLALEAARQLQQLTGSEVEGITGLHRTEEGWRVQVDVVELRRVPTTTDVIATYDVEVDEHGDLTGYRRHHRFVRGEVSDER